MANQTLDVRGMTCQHCVDAVEKSVGAVDGVQQVNVDLDNGKVAVAYDDSKATVDNIRDAIEDQGYEVIPTEA
ncbi:copper resistance protein CopZ [Macrococcus brunensis]|uniref:Copper chaperone CopZ n=1 Tax=Macrococcus brunensis TaxID=198483 RepID=A0A4R6BE53_9STAP|nr:copper chaperone CopZ [Macrococcus brunensis]TDL98029.1 copper resistance protein CopZ [Macrococcus brunensis]ULG74596.1 copper chaperone CopZ [Macrococcus brunensis]